MEKKVTRKNELAGKSADTVKPKFKLNKRTCSFIRYLRVGFQQTYNPDLDDPSFYIDHNTEAPMSFIITYSFYALS